MKYLDMKVGMRVVVTHHSSKHKGTAGTIVKCYNEHYPYADVKLDGLMITREFHCDSINPAPAAKPAPKEPEGGSKPLTADDIVVGTELIYKGSVRSSSRRAGDVYVVYQKFTECGITIIRYRFKSGNRPIAFEEQGVLPAGEILKFWEVAL